MGTDRRASRWLGRVALALAVASPLLVGASTGASGAVASGNGSWGPVADWGLQAKHMATLPSGKVMVFSTGANARVWDPATNGFTANTPAVFGDLHCAGNAQLADGRLVVLGGQNGGTHIGTPVTALFDPVAQSWTQGAPMAYSRWYASVTPLPDGRVLATSGDDERGARVTTPEIYDPLRNTWTKLTGGVRNQQLYPHMYVLPNGKVFEAAPGSSTAILDTSGTGSWSPGPVNGWSTNGYSESSVMYEPGKIMRAGGGDPAIARTAVVDMNQASPQWQETSPMAFPRRRMNLVLMADGQVLAIGGTARADDEASAVLPAEIWNPETRTWRTVAGMSEARMYHSSAVLLADGRVLVGGGEAAGRLRAQIYSPPYLTAGPRPTIGSAPSSSAYGASISVTSAQAADITSVALIRLSTATHAWDQNQRYVPLSFTRSGTTLTANAPANANLAPPGTYQLVVKTGAGVPSVGRMIRIDSAGKLVPGSVSGTVTDTATGGPLSGARVSTASGSATTNAAGSYRLDGLASGEHEITVSATGYAPVSRSVIVNAGATTTSSFSLSAPGAVTGTVTLTPGGTPVANAQISYTGGSVTTDTSGRYTISNLPAGPLDLNVTAAGYADARRTVTVVSGSSVTADFGLTRAATFITGGVVDGATDRPVVGARVTLDTGASAVTDSLGSYRIDVPPGMYMMTAAATGYTTTPQAHATVTEGTYAVVDFKLDAAGSGGGTPLKRITLENTSLTDPATGADQVSGTVTRDTTAPLAGTASAKFTAATSAYLRENVVATDDLFVSGLLRTASSPTGDSRILMVQNGTSTVGQVQLRASGRLRLRLGTTTIGAESAALTPGTTYRVGLHQKRGTGGNAVLEAFLAPAGSAFGAPFARSTTGTWTTAGTSVRFGATSGAALSASFDDVFLDAGAFGGATGGTTPAPPPPPPPPPSGGTTTTFAPTADAQVKSTSPGTNYGSLTSLRLRGGTTASPGDYKSYLRFAVAGVTAPVSSAKLRLYVSDASSVGGTVFPTTSAWTESGLTHDNGPAPSGAALSTGGRATLDTYLELDVTSAVTGNGTIDLLLTSTSTDSVIFHSREGANPPQLVVTHP